ncbi:hypothetical protein MJO55_07270 [Mycolicibacterium rufum]|uniref:Uncharacterized protein n=1 Tax=Mycolicibacterium rufum TaxID=318424 RepID=A0A9X2YHR5_9MYCO|nr:hypothetical protein [Mycolicibacterium rufum]KGI67302.1 hypothetical protein EU78_07385 [Mycolicibacterium rufum]MCV7073470.1 hypothetical protein [Mycolicibacterium rufum]ULP38220.1 hypothetical protein MJO55_07270 [Mycolicibacterium rufum]
MTWVLVAVGGAAGSAVGALLMRRPTGTRLLLATSVVCGLTGMLSAQLLSPKLTAVFGYGVLGSAASMVTMAVVSPMWVGGDAPVRSTVAVTKKLAVHCVVGVTFALLGYLAVRGGATLYKKLT